MIFISVRFVVKPEHVDGWPERVAEFTAATRAEPGNLFFDWSRDLEHPNRFTLVEGFRDSEAGAVHVKAPHFAAGLAAMAPAIAETPQIVYADLPEQADWNPMAELTPQD
ncbi:putative quinol monooxygenase [Streptomyces sp. BI20]|uniref:putative quinol monooxygenase n=1 Tax=Streptomyces sp. BI20 TaxID=3403460 RepID=UPI003C779F6B